MVVVMAMPLLSRLAVENSAPARPDGQTISQLMKWRLLDGVFKSMLLAYRLIRRPLIRTTQSPCLCAGSGTAPGPLLLATTDADEAISSRRRCATIVDRNLASDGKSAHRRTYRRR